MYTTVDLSEYCVSSGQEVHSAGEKGREKNDDLPTLATFLFYCDGTGCN